VTAPTHPVTREEESTDTLAYLRQGIYFRFSGQDDTLDLFRQLAAVRPLPGYHVSYARPPEPDNFFRPLPRQFRLADLRVTMYHHEFLWLNDVANRQNTGLHCDPELLLNAWKYEQGVLEFPQLRTAAGPLTQFNRQLQARYELYGPDNETSARWEGRAQQRGTPIWDFGRSAAQLAHYSFYQGADSSAAADKPLRWRDAYRLLDTTRFYERFPTMASLVVLGGTHRLLGLVDYHKDEAERFPDPTDAAAAWAAQSPDYYSLRLARRVGYRDLFRPALAAAIWRAARPLLRQVRAARHQLPLTPAQWRELARPRYWAFSARGWHAVYLADAEPPELKFGQEYQRYRLDVEVFIPYARLRAYLRP
jgi:hypothetical protein